jgi:hypothetical protein
MTKKKVGQAREDDNLVMDQKKQTLYMGIMHVDDNRFLVTAGKPLQPTYSVE